MCRYIADMMLGFQNPLSVVREHGLFKNCFCFRNLTFSTGSFTEEQLEWKRGGREHERVGKCNVFDYMCDR